MRFERKFIVHNVDIFLLKQKLKLINLNFSKKYEDRFINNIYFDTNSKTSFYDNIEGNFFRQKLRIRWYGDFFGEIKKPVLEFKVKKGLMGFKKKYKIDTFEMSNDLSSLSSLNNVLNNENLKQHKNIFKISIANRYKREYYQSHCNKYRITIDGYVKYFNLEKSLNFQSNFDSYGKSIIELKYGVEDTNINHITNQLGLRLTKNSKYVNGFNDYKKK